MHLEFDGSSLTGEAEEKNIGDSNSNNAVREYVQQLEVKISTLEGVLRQLKDDANKLIDRLGKLEKDNTVDESSDVGNKAAQDNCSKQVYDENKLSGQHNDTEIDSASNEHDTRREEKLKFFDAGPKCVHVQNFKCSDVSFSRAFLNIHELAPISDNSIISIRIVVRSADYLDYHVYFRDEDNKKEFLKLVQ